MKTKALSSFLYVIAAMLLLSFSDPYLIKRISDANFRYEFYTTDKKIEPKENKTYYWFKGGLIHNSQSGMAGELLNDKFVKMYHSNQLAEQGVFKNGLKVGLWKTWYENGIVETTQKWKNGLRNGEFLHFNEQGIIIEQGKYKKNIKHGIWIDFTNKDTITYRRGIILKKELKLSSEEKAKLKKEKETAKEKAKALKKEAKSQKEAELKKTPENQPKKEGFFKKLFHKKQTKKKVDD